MRYLVRVVPLLGLIAVTGACAAEDSNEGAAPVVDRAASSMTVSPFRADIAEPTLVRDAKGRDWIGRPITAFATRPPEGIALEKEGGNEITDIDLDALSDEKLAELWSPVRLVSDRNGNHAEYRLATIDAEAVAEVRLARQREHNGLSMISYGPGQTIEFYGDKPPPRPGTKLDTPKNRLLFTPQAIRDYQVGILNRSPSTQISWPWSNSVIEHTGPLAGTVSITAPTPDRYTTPQVIIPPGDERLFLPHTEWNYWPHITSMSFIGGGSGTLIGRATAMSAAHVFYKQFADVNGPAGYYPKPDFKIATVRTTDRLSAPPTYTTSGSQQYPDDCYDLILPQSYINGSDAGYDWAILDFNTFCRFFPGSQYGWVNPGYINSLTGYNTNLPVQMTAFDLENPQPPNQGTFTAYAPPSMIARAKGPGNMWRNPSKNWQLRHWMSARSGSSGGGILTPLFNSELLWIGVNYAESPSGGYNLGRLLTAGMWTLIQSWSSEF